MDKLDVQARWDAQGRPWPECIYWPQAAERVTAVGRRWTDDAGEHMLCMLETGAAVELIYLAGSGWTVGFQDKRARTA